MLKKLILICSFSFRLLASGDSSCPQLDPSVKDPDGVLLCPDIVKTASAWRVYSCAIGQATSFHAPTSQEKSLMNTLLEGWQNSRVSDMLQSADGLNLQVCRVRQTVNNQADSYLLFYTKPGVKDYSGPFMMLRETQKSKVLVIGPHDDSDGTYADTKFATSETTAMGTISNGHIRSKVGDGKDNDFVHSSGPDSNLGTWVVKKICDMNKASVVLHIHGMKDPSKVLYRDRDNQQMSNAWEKAVQNHTNISQFGPLNADFSIDPLVNTNWYVKTEMPARIHVDNKMALANIVKEIETYPWARNN